MEKDLIVLQDNLGINREILLINLKRITNQIYKLLPMREEGSDWKKPLETVLVEIYGLNEILEYPDTELLTLICKLKGLQALTGEEEFLLYRRTIFECLELLEKVKTYAQELG